MIVVVTARINKLRVENDTIKQIQIILQYVEHNEAYGELILGRVEMLH